MRYSSYNRVARTAKSVPRVSTCTFTPISNMSAAGAIATSVGVAFASNSRTASEVPASRVAWLMLPVTTYAAPIENAVATLAGVAMPPAAPMRGRWAYRRAVQTSSRSACSAGSKSTNGRLSV